MLKRIVSLALCLAVLLVVFSVRPRTQNETAPLWIVTDLNIPVKDLPDNVSKDFCETAAWMLNRDRQDIVLEFLPVDETERNVRLTKLRTEIMAGGGPDVFLFNCNRPVGSESRTFWKNRPMEMSRIAPNVFYYMRTWPERLFPDVQKIMRNDVLLPLDPYLSAAEHIDMDNFLPAVRDACTTEEGLMILPLFITFSTAVYAKAGEDLDTARQTAFRATGMNRFPDRFGKLADYEGRELLFSEADLLEAVRDVLSFGTENVPKMGEDGWNTDAQAFSPRETGGLLYLTSLNTANTMDWTTEQYANVDLSTGSTWVVPTTATNEERIAFKKTHMTGGQMIEPVRNTSGGVTASILTYACVNRNTKRPEDAVRILDCFYQMTSTDTDNGYDFQQGKGYATYLMWGSAEDGLPARNDLLRDGSTTSDWSYIGSSSCDPAPSEERFAEYTALREQVTDARFYGTLDEELQALLNACREAETEQEIEKLVTDTYGKMKVMVGE